MHHIHFFHTVTLFGQKNMKKKVKYDNFGKFLTGQLMPMTNLLSYSLCTMFSFEGDSDSFK